MFPRQTRLSIGFTGVLVEGNEFLAVRHLDDVAKQLLIGQIERLDFRSLPTVRNIQYLECAGLASKQNDLALLGNELLAAHRDSLRPCLSVDSNCTAGWTNLVTPQLKKSQCQLGPGKSLDHASAAISHFAFTRFHTVRYLPWSSFFVSSFKGTFTR